MSVLFPAIPRSTALTSSTTSTSRTTSPKSDSVTSCAFACKTPTSTSGNAPGTRSSADPTLKKSSLLSNDFTNHSIQPRCQFDTITVAHVSLPSCPFASSHVTTITHFLRCFVCLCFPVISAMKADRKGDIRMPFLLRINISQAVCNSAFGFVFLLKSSRTVAPLSTIFVRSAMARKLIFPRKKTEPLDNEQQEILALGLF